MGMSAPKGPSQSQIKTEAQLEAERVKYENEKRRFIENVAQYELIASDQRRALETSFEFTPTGVAPPEGSGLFIPAKFTPSFNPTDWQGNKYAASNMDWFNAPNLGINLPASSNQSTTEGFNWNRRRR